MLGLVTALATPLLKGIFGTIDKAVVDKDMAIKLKNDLQQQTMDILSTEVKASSSTYNYADICGNYCQQLHYLPIPTAILQLRSYAGHSP